LKGWPRVKMSKKIKAIILIIGFFGIFMAANFVLAADFGVNEVNNGLGGSLSSTDPRILVGRIIQIALSFLGAIALVIIMYAGFLWMTSNGDEEKVNKAKDILKNAIIGLVIILASWAIATFIISRLAGAMDGGGGGNFFDNSRGNFSSAGAGAIGACSVESVYPTDGQNDVPRNTSVMITFKEELKLDSICINAAGDSCTCNPDTCNKINPKNIRLYKTDSGDACSDSSCPNPNINITDILVSVPSGNKTLVLMPASPLGSANGNTNYTVKFTDQVKRLDNSSVFKGCGNNYLAWTFIVSNVFDLTPPLVVRGSAFPLPDNEKDIFQETTPAKAAQGLLTVNSCPNIYSAATVISVTPSSATVVLDYHGQLSNFKVSVPAEAPNKAQLFGSNNNLLGIVDFDDQGQAIFPNYLTFQVSDHPAGSFWEIVIKPEQLADTLVIDNTSYTFSATAENNNIKVPTNCNPIVQATNIEAKLSGQPEIEVARNGNRVVLEARVAGESGNNISVSTTNNSALNVQPLSGGTDQQKLDRPRGEKDRPMNSVIQLNFNEPVNPMTVAGTAAEVAKYIRVVNAELSSPAGTACNQNSQCRSYKCENSVCVGDYVGGKFVISNGYRTVEFISDQECGVNGCGEKIYCLPANSHLAVEAMAANLKICNSDADCAAFNPFKACALTPLGYKTCQNLESKNYPTANFIQLDGIVDAAINSFDGDRSTYSDGPLGFYNENDQVAQGNDKKDKYTWSFYINDQIMLVPPQITSVLPAQGQSGINLADPVIVNFNTLMMNSTLATGKILVNNGTSTIEHKLMNLRSASPSPLGYWVLNDNIDIEPLDGEPDLTIARIFHTPFAESMTFAAQVGSGVKDIYQNCYKPSVGPGCAATPEAPSCCFGAAVSQLGVDGNCQ